MRTNVVNLTLAVVTAVLMIIGVLEMLFQKQGELGFSLIIIGLALSSITLMKPHGRNNDTNTTK